MPQKPFKVYLLFRWMIALRPDRPKQNSEETKTSKTKKDMESVPNS